MMTWREKWRAAAHPASSIIQSHLLLLPVMAGLDPAIPMMKSAAPHRSGITGTGSVMTKGTGLRPASQAASYACGQGLEF
ncbi:hypothetical protein J4G37_11870 [Microvirga sp. 3-52]|nr:hypothetical protein [Microvirga sp. 3-52]